MTPEEWKSIEDKVSAMDDFREKTERNKRIQARYNQLMVEGKHGHWETIFRIVREEIERDRQQR
jgi:hypothetical protein